MPLWHEIDVEKLFLDQFSAIIECVKIFLKNGQNLRMFKNGARVLRLMRSMQKNGFQTDIWINNECQIGFVTNREEL